MRRPEGAAEAEVEVAAVAAEFRMPSAAADMSAAAECMGGGGGGPHFGGAPRIGGGPAMAACVAAARLTWAALMSAARLASPAGRRYRGLRRVPFPQPAFVCGSRQSDRAAAPSRRTQRLVDQTRRSAEMPKMRNVSIGQNRSATVKSNAVRNALNSRCGRRRVAQQSRAAQSEYPRPDRRDRGHRGMA